MVYLANAVSDITALAAAVVWTAICRCSSAPTTSPVDDSGGVPLVGLHGKLGSQARHRERGYSRAPLPAAAADAKPDEEHRRKSRRV